MCVSNLLNRNTHPLCEVPTRIKEDIVACSQCKAVGGAEGKCSLRGVSWECD